jgi:hypothetical protein
MMHIMGIYDYIPLHAIVKLACWPIHESRSENTFEIYILGFLSIKPTDALSSNFIIGIITLHVSGSLSAQQQELLSRYNGIGTIYAAR